MKKNTLFALLLLSGLQCFNPEMVGVIAQVSTSPNALHAASNVGIVTLQRDQKVSTKQLIIQPCLSI